MKINRKEVTILTTCPFCGHANEVAVNEADYWDWQDGALAQDAFPYLSADEREMLISGICGKCWNKMFDGEEEEEREEKEAPRRYYTFSGEWYFGCWARSKEEAERYMEEATIEDFDLNFERVEVEVNDL